jgi:WD40 repeat protein
VKLWDVAGHKEIISINSRSGHASSMMFSPDSHTLATAGYDRKAKLWNAATG